MAGTHLAGLARGLRPLSPRLIIMHTPSTCPGCRQVAPGFTAFAQCCCPDSLTSVLLTYNCCSFEASITPHPCCPLVVQPRWSPTMAAALRAPHPCCPRSHTAALVTHNGCSFETSITPHPCCPRSRTAVVVTHNGCSFETPTPALAADRLPWSLQPSSSAAAQTGTFLCWWPTMAVALTSRSWCKSTGGWD